MSYISEVTSLTSLLLVMMIGCGWAADPGTAPTPSLPSAPNDLSGVEILSPIHAIMSQAAAMGMPTAIGATLFSGHLTSPHQQRFSHADIASAPALIHARLSDGSWLVDMWDHVPVDQLDQGEIKALHALAPSDLTNPDIYDFLPRYPWQDGILRYANLMQAGIEPAAQALIDDYRRHVDGAVLDNEPVATYPRQPFGRTPENCVRLVCRWWFLNRLQEEPAAARWGNAAVDIAPVAWRPGTAAGNARRTASQAVSADQSGAIAALDKLVRWTPQGEIGIDNRMLPSLDEQTLIDLAGDLTPARSFGPECATAGDRALLILGERWGVDPALCASRDPAAAWDDLEHQALALGLKAWWTRTTGMTWTERFASVTPTLSVHSLQYALLRRERQRDEQRWSVADRLRNRTYEGDPPVPYPDDQQALLQAIAHHLVISWHQPPADALPCEMIGLIARFQTIPAFCDMVESWPRTGRYAAVMAAWDDEHGHHQGVNALVQAWLAQPARDEPALTGQGPLAATGPDPTLLRPATSTPLMWWVAHGLPDRWAGLQAILAGALTSEATARLLAGCGMPWFTSSLSAQQGVNLSWPLLFVTLGDHRQLSPALIRRLVRSERERWLASDDFDADGLQPHASPHNASVVPAADLRVCDFVLFQALASQMIDRDLLKRDHTVSAITIASALTERDRVIDIVKAVIEPESAHALQDLQTNPHVAMGFLAQAPAVPVVPATPGGLTSAEAVACKEVLVQAQALGFPDLHGAQVVTGDLTGTGRRSWQGMHLHLANGSWLAEGYIPRGAAEVTASGPSETPTAQSRPGMSALLSRLIGDDQARYLANAVITRHHEESPGLGMAALAWWSSGIDPTGKSVVDACLLSAATQQETACIFPTDGYRGGEDTRGPAEVPELATGVRRIAARWFCDQLTLASSGADATRWAGAARSILATSDRVAWEAMIDRLQLRAGIPLDPGAHADLAERIASWGEQLNHPVNGLWKAPGPPPANLSDTAALIALLADPRPSRWVESRIPMTLGDACLIALNHVWGFDWRWIALSDPQVDACFPPTHAHVEATGDEWRLVSAIWTDHTRATVAQALQTWWKHTGSLSAHAPVLAALEQAPVAVLTDIIPGMPHDMLDEAAAALLARRLPPVEDAPSKMGSIDLVIMAALCFPNDAAITSVLASWPQTAWLRSLSIMRAGIGGNDAMLDQWFVEPLAGRGLPPPQAFEPQTWETAVSPWMNLGLIVYRPTPQRLAMLRSVLAGDLERPSTLWLLSCLGCRYYPLSRDLEELLCRSDEARAACLPAQLALDGLSDRRALTPSEVAMLLTLSRQSLGEAVDLSQCPKPRVCDQVAARLLTWAHRFNRTWNPLHVHDDQAFLAAPPAQRDRELLQISASFTPIVAEDLTHVHMNVP